MGRIERPARGFYAHAPANPVFSEETAPTDEGHDKELVHSILNKIEDDTLRLAATAFALKEVAGSQDPATAYGVVLRRLMRGELLPEEHEEPQPLSPKPKASALNQTAATTPTPKPTSSLNQTAATTPTPKPTSSLEQTATRIPGPEPTSPLEQTSARIPDPEPASPLEQTATRIPGPEPTSPLEQTATRIPDPESASSLEQTSAVIPAPELTRFPNIIDTSTPYRTETTSSGLKFIVMTPEQLREKALREMSIEDDHPRGPWRRLSLNNPYPS
jgi:hypothetical protein